MDILIGLAFVVGQCAITCIFGLVPSVIFSTVILFFAIMRAKFPIDYLSDISDSLKRIERKGRS
ncbi:MAG: hypothetical protein IKH18_01505 [Clostridia bacterium]|nr:hypothetical protein [Clostridia bacterium]